MSDPFMADYNTNTKKNDLNKKISSMQEFFNVHATKRRQNRFMNHTRETF